MSIKVAELFFSLQGEGVYQGVPSVFLRTFGCNFTCQGFAMPRGKLSIERELVDPAKYEKYDDLPLVHTGCDSYASWDPRFKNMSPLLEIPAIVDRMQQLLPGGKFGPDKHLIITGGEPLLGWQKQYIELLEEIKRRDMGLTNLTFETNGTQELRDDLGKYLGTSDIEVTFSVSAKLPSSGEKWEDAIRPEVVVAYIDKTYNGYESATVYFKYVISNHEDYLDVQKALDAYYDAGLDCPIYVMPAGGTGLHYDENRVWVAEMAMKHGWRYSSRLQVDLWGNAWST